MVDTDVFPAGLVAIGMSGVFAFIVGVSVLAAQYGGIWAGLTTGAFFVTAAAAVLLYAFGQIEVEARERRRGR